MKKAIIIISVLLAAASFTFGQTTRAFKPQAELASVRIMAGNFNDQRVFRPTQSGSGAIISADGLVITSREVILDANGNVHPELWAGLVNQSNRGLPLNRAYKLKLVKESKPHDLALLQIVTETKRNFLPLKIGSTESLAYGDYLGVVGFPNARVTVADCELLGIDETGTWLYAEGALLKGMLGSAVVNDKGELIGIAVKAVDNKTVPFFDENNSPIGEVVLDKVGLISSIETILEFVRPNTQTSFPTVSQAKGIEIEGAITTAGTNMPVTNATIGILAKTALNGTNQIESDELIGYAKTDNRGAFKVNRKLRPGKYLVKVIAVGFETVVKEITVPQPAGRLILEMNPVKR
jgi:S1-C subfamily serine protease